MSLTLFNTLIDWFFTHPVAAFTPERRLMNESGAGIRHLRDPSRSSPWDMLCCRRSALSGVREDTVILLELKEVNGCPPFHWFHLNSLQQLMPLAWVPREGFILSAATEKGRGLDVRKNKFSGFHSGLWSCIRCCWTSPSY